VELVAGADGELGEDLPQVVLDGAGAHEKLASDLGVGQAAAGQPGDLGLPAVSWAGRPVVRLRTRSPVASSSRLLRLANPSAPKPLEQVARPLTEVGSEGHTP
jgi:hypothetical protein